MQHRCCSGTTMSFHCIIFSSLLSISTGYWFCLYFFLFNVSVMIESFSFSFNLIVGTSCCWYFSTFYCIWKCSKKLCRLQRGQIGNTSVRSIHTVMNASVDFESKYTHTHREVERVVKSRDEKWLSLQWPCIKSLWSERWMADGEEEERKVNKWRSRAKEVNKWNTHEKSYNFYVFYLERMRVKS